VLWERTAPHGPERANWRWPDERLGRIRELGLVPLVGLVHHGSGPPDTSVVDPSFPDRLALFARAVAERYPWVERFTPVNEPLTTARFSGLYGHWYPHGQDDRTFVRALLTQCRAVVPAGSPENEDQSASPSQIGSLRVKVVPLPASESTVSSPPCAVAIPRAR